MIFLEVVFLTVHSFNSYRLGTLSRPSWENRDLRQLLWHRHRMVKARTRVMNQLQAVALNEGLRCKKRLWRERGRQQVESFHLAPWASRRRREAIAAPTEGNRQRPIICSTTHAPDQARGQPQLLQCELNLTSPSLSYSAFRLELIFMRFRGPQARTDTWDSPDIAMVCSRTPRY